MSIRRNEFWRRAARVAFVVCLFGLSLVLLWSVLRSPSAKAAIRDSASQSLVIGSTDEPLSLDPAGAYDFASWEILRNVGSGLLTYVPGTTELTPGLATALPDVSQDGTVYTFTLRSGLSFPDGAPVNASAVKWSIDRVAALGVGPSWLVTDFVSETRVVDDTTVKFVLKERSSLFPHLVASTPYFPVSPTCFPNDRLDPGSTCGGLGPYTVTGWMSNVSVTLEANPGYYGSQPKASSVTVRYFDDAASLRRALEKGQVDVAWKTLSSADYEQLGESADFEVVKGGSSYIRYLCFNTTEEPFDTPEVRKAFAAAVERETIAADVYADTMKALYSMVPQGMWSHVSTFRDRYSRRDLAEARRLLEQAGYSEEDKLGIDLWHSLDHYGPQEPAFAGELAADLEETGLISVTVRGENWSDYAGNLRSGAMHVFLLGWYPDYLDPDNYTWPFAHSTTSGDLGIFYSDDQMDRLLEAGRSTTPVQGPARTAVYEDVQELWSESVPTVPLLQGRLMAVTRNGIRGVNVSPLGTLPLFTIWDAQVTTTVDPGRPGGLTAADRSTTVAFPAGGVTGTVVVTHTPLSQVRSGGSLSSIGNAFDLTAVYSETGQPAQPATGSTYTVTARYSETNLGPTVEDTLGLYWWDEGTGQWTQEGITSSVNVTDDVVEAHVNHFSRFAVLGETHRVYLPLLLRQKRILCEVPGNGRHLEGRSR